ncbi:murein transglycosylase domain-containing protein [bacterium endosymbiont of Pedicinus badii]|uniref:murein transglycosylase domain-containing protein n=1 Tax=bacterium endosymbiont of Pedicinus badii TaxID=1719126 RepID=UPI0009B99C4A|nr:murein transglycosylase domain-containing protein [bacterium endosymbiont of Pedicinus badii]OQM34026.1 hypothetical protein AOQ89_01540 [bacterium endosymbiont of Pedicinus badii]
MKIGIIFFILVQIFFSCSLQNKGYLFKFLKNLTISEEIKNKWGKKELIRAKSKFFVRYLNPYTRIYIDLKSKKLFIETIHKNKYREYLKKGLIDSILKKKVEYFDIFTEKEMKYQFEKKIVFLNKNQNNFNNFIQSQYFIEKIADQFLDRKISMRKSDIKVWYINVKIKLLYINEKMENYMKIVKKISKKYSIDPYLVLAMIQIESKFNPNAISASQAIGLMQIIQKSAGREVFIQKGKNGFPSKKQLLNPSNNIEIGVSYLSILQNKYLYRVKNKKSLQYLIICSYNSGVNKVLRIFSNNMEQSISIINNLEENEIYSILYEKHPSTQSRNYLYKVSLLYNYYKNSIVF